MCALIMRRPPGSTLTDTLSPYTTLCRSPEVALPPVPPAPPAPPAAPAPPAPPVPVAVPAVDVPPVALLPPASPRSEEHTSELQSLMRISYADFCLKTKTNDNIRYKTHT